PGLVLADDSGLEDDSLGGAPGAFSARYAGAEASDWAMRQKLLVELAKRGPDAARLARFHCALALAWDGRVLALCEGSVAGQIVRQARGSAGFGYDPLFQPNEFSETFAELPAATKNSISHRGRAVTKMKQFLRGANLLKYAEARTVGGPVVAEEVVSPPGSLQPRLPLPARPVHPAHLV